ncbi:hypothetical protein [Diaphorobacter sp. J5-51]|uniref:hypothetical protein n=1 Tax=Diaphorobacter sp. J5-51 TaxID=680496 RepID=UPI0012F7D10C|nr:hypothetical protein [Diaphorobacter sp. J5-51]
MNPSKILLTLLLAVSFVGGCTTPVPEARREKFDLPVAAIDQNPAEDFKEFFSKTLDQADRGNPDAMLNAGAIFLSGSKTLFGVDQVDANLDQSFFWYKKLSENPDAAIASQGAKNAGFVLVQRYRSSHSPQDLDGGLEFLSKASKYDTGALMLLSMYQVEFDRNSAVGQKNLAMLAQKGNDVAREFINQHSAGIGK